MWRRRLWSSLFGFRYQYLPFYLYDADLEDFLEVAQPSSRTGSKNVGLKAGLFVWLTLLQAGNFWYYQLWKKNGKNRDEDVPPTSKFKPTCLTLSNWLIHEVYQLSITFNCYCDIWPLWNTFTRLISTTWRVQTKYPQPLIMPCISAWLWEPA